MMILGPALIFVFTLMVALLSLLIRAIRIPPIQLEPAPVRSCADSLELSWDTGLAGAWSAKPSQARPPRMLSEQIDEAIRMDTPSAMVTDHIAG